MTRCVCGGFREGAPSSVCPSGLGDLTQDANGMYTLDVDLDSQIPEKSSVFAKVLLGLALAWAAWKVSR